MDEGWLVWKEDLEELIVIFGRLSKWKWLVFVILAFLCFVGVDYIFGCGIYVFDLSVESFGLFCVLQEICRQKIFQLLLKMGTSGM